MIEFTEKPRNRNEFYKFMCDHGRSLSSLHDFSWLIKIKHLDGSEFDLRYCHWDECEDIVYIWSEHCGYFYFYKADLEIIDAKSYDWDNQNSKFRIVEHTIIKFNIE